MNKILIEKKILVLREREIKLKMLWGSSEDADYKRNVVRASNEIHNQIQALYFHLGAAVKEEREQQLEFDNSLALLSCGTFGCDGIGMAMKTYLESEHFCETCQRQLLTEEEIANMQELRLLGIEV